jgi:hypothetical protein
MTLEIEWGVGGSNHLKHFAINKSLHWNSRRALENLNFLSSYPSSVGTLLLCPKFVRVLQSKFHPKKSGIDN